jgi:hypothetical protein
MSRRKFTKEEIEIIAKNENVSKCSEKSITYRPNFKLEAIKRYREGKGSREIFEDAGFDILIIGKKTPKNCLGDWNKIYSIKGADGLKKETRGKAGGRPKKPKDLSDKDKIKRLEAEIAYLKAENDFFTKLRAKRAERYSSRNTGTR